MCSLRIYLAFRVNSGFHRWLTLGNQLGPDQIYEEDLAARIKAKYVRATVSFTRFFMLSISIDIQTETSASL